MSRTALIAITCVLGFAGMAAPALAADGAAAEVPAALQPTEAEVKGYYDLSLEGQRTVTKVLGVWMEEMRAAKSDPEKLCRLTGEMYAAYAQSTQVQMDYLLKLRAGFKSIDTLIGSWLGTSRGMDDARIRQQEQCSEVEAKARGLDDEQEMGLFIGKIEQDLAKVERGYRDAKASGNTIAEAGHIQTQAAYLKEMVENAEILRDYGEGDNKAIVAKIPAWEARRKTVDGLMTQKVYIYTDPDNARNAPYVFTPFVTPSMPANDDAFDKSMSNILSVAVSPMMEALRLILVGDRSGACTQMRNAQSELQRARAFVTSYVDAQAARGTATDRGVTILPKIDELLVKVRSAIGQQCAATDA